MAGSPEIPSKFDIPSINPSKNIDYGSSYDGADPLSHFKNGAFYTKREITILGGGDEEKALGMIADEIVRELLSDDDKEPEFRPYHKRIEELNK